MIRDTPGEDPRLLERIQKLADRVADLESRRPAWDVVQDVAESGCDDIDERLRYVVVQVDRGVWRELRRLCGLPDDTKPDLP